MKYLTTIDFGKITYEKEFYDMLNSYKLDITYKDRCKGSFFLKNFRMFIVETKIN